jgi:hypothetical protein
MEHKENMHAIVQNLQPLLWMLNMSPICIRRFNKHKKRTSQTLKLLLRITTILLFYATLCISSIAMYNAAMKVKKTSIDNLALFMTILLFLILLCHCASITYACVWYRCDMVNKFCCTLSKVHFISFYFQMNLGAKR